MPPAKSRKPAVPVEIARLTSTASVLSALAWFEAEAARLTEWQLELARIPAPPFGESARAEWLRDRFTELGLENVNLDEVGNVVGIARGSALGRPFIAVTAHLDTVFPPGTRLNIRREGGKLMGAGVSDNAAGVTALLAMVAVRKAAQLEHAAPIVFIGNVGEEGEGDLRGMRHIFSSPRWRDSIAHALILDGAGTDTIVTQALGSRRYELTVRGPGGHSWNDFGAPNPIAVLCRALALFYETPLPAGDNLRSSYSVGVISGGTSVNSIPEYACARMDIRSTSPEEIERLASALRSLLERAAREERGLPARRASEHSSDVRVDISLIGDRPAAELAENARILNVVRQVDAHLGIRSRLHRASTDANIPLSMGREAVSLGAGGSGGNSHTLQEWYDPAGRELGLRRILLSILTLAEMAREPKVEVKA